jgi:WD40 repeat protein
VFLLKDAFEAAIKYLGAILLAEYRDALARTPERDAALLERLVRPSLGVWVNVVLGDVGRWLVGNTGPGGAAATLFIRPPNRAGEKPAETELFADCRQFVEYRNEVLGHGASRTDSAYTADLARWLPVLRRLLDGVAGLDAWRLCLVADVDRCQVWTGDDPAHSTEPGSFPRGLVGQFVIRGPVSAVQPLDPFVCYIPGPNQEQRLHFYDAVYRYTVARKELTLLEYDEGFKRVSPDPVPALEAAFTAELLAAAFGRHRGKMAVIEGRVANFGELIEAHAGIVGRRSIVNRVKRFVGENDRGLLVITGEPGRGKTALLAHLIDEVFGHYAPPPVHFFYRRTAGITDPDVCIRSLYHALLTAHGLTEAAESKRQTDPEEQARKLDDLLANHVGPKLLPSRPQLIFIDALDEADPTSTGRTAFHRMPANLPAGVYVVAATRPVADRSALARRPHLHWLDLDAPDFEVENLADGREYVERELVEVDLPDETRAAVAAAGAGNFLVLKLLCAQARDGLTADGVRDFLRRLSADGAVDRLGFVYGEFWQRLTDRLPLEELRLVADVAGVLVWAKAPLTAEVVCRVLRRPAAEVDRAVRRLAEYLTAVRYEEDGAEETFYRLYHESFADFVRAALAADRDRLAGALADFCLHWAELPDGFGRMYALRFGPTHLRELSRWDDLERLLTDWQFLEAKTEAGYVFDLAGDLGEAARALPADRSAAGLLRMIRAAILPELRFIADHPAALFQCAWNAGWWHGGSLAAWLEAWRAGRDRPWLRSVRPPAVPLTTTCVAVVSFPDEGPRCVTFSPDGSQLAIGTVEGGVWVWDLRRREGLRLSGPADKVDAVAFSADDTLLAAGYRDGALYVWDTPTGAEVARFSWEDDLAVMRESGFDPGAIMPRGSWVNQGIYDLSLSGGTLYTLFGHEASKRLILRIHPPLEGISSLWVVSGGLPAGAVSPAGVYAYSHPGLSPGAKIIEMLTRVGGAIRLKNLGDGSAVERDFKHTGEMAQSLRFSPDGSRLASGGLDGVVRFWDVASGRELWHSAVRRGEVKPVAVAADGTVAAGAGEGTIWLGGGADGVERARLPGHARYVWGLAFSPDGSALASVGGDDLVRVWDLGSLPGTGNRSAADHVGDFRAVAVSPDGTRVATGTYFGEVWVWSVADGVPVVTTPRHTGRVTDVQFSPDSSLLVSGSDDGTARVWAVRTGEELARSGEPVNRVPTGNIRVDVLGDFSPEAGVPPMVEAVRFTPDGLQVAYRSDRVVVWGWRKRSWWRWRGTSGRQLALDGPPIPPAALRFSADGLEAIHDGHRYSWNPESGALTGDVASDEEPSAAPAGRWSGSSDQWGRETAIRSPDGTIVAWCPGHVRPGPPPHGDRVWTATAGDRLDIYVLEGVDARPTSPEPAGSGP